jgi:hypothetical protein
VHELLTSAVAIPESQEFVLTATKIETAPSRLRYFALVSAACILLCSRHRDAKGGSAAAALVTFFERKIHGKIALVKHVHVARPPADTPLALAVKEVKPPAVVTAKRRYAAACPDRYQRLTLLAAGWTSCWRRRCCAASADAWAARATPHSPPAANP